MTRKTKSGRSGKSGKSDKADKADREARKIILDLRTLVRAAVILRERYLHFDAYSDRASGAYELLLEIVENEGRGIKES